MSSLSHSGWGISDQVGTAHFSSPTHIVILRSAFFAGRRTYGFLGSFRSDGEMLRSFVGSRALRSDSAASGARDAVVLDDGTAVYDLAQAAWHHVRGEFQRVGYFPGREWSSERPLLFLVVPALHVHPATDTLLHPISPEIEWVVGVSMSWRDGVRAVFRKRPRDMELKADPRARDCA